MPICNLFIRGIAFCLVLLSSSPPAAATDNLWASWLHFNDTPTASNLYVDCWIGSERIGKELARSYKITKAKHTNLKLFELQNGSWVPLSDARFTDSYVEFDAEAEGPIDVVEYFGWESAVTKEFLSYVASIIPEYGSKILKQNLQYKYVDPNGQPRLFGINLEEYVEVKDRASWSKRLNFREKGLIYLSEHKILKEGQLSYRFIDRKDYAEGTYNHYLTKIIYAGDNYTSSNYYTQLLDCTPVN